MGLFRKKTKGTSGPVVDFLNKVDDAYTEVFISKSIAPLQPYATHDVLSSVLHRMHLGEEAYAGLNRYMHRDWTKVSETPEQYVKSVTYDNVKLSRGIVATVGDSYQELWTLENNTGNLQVTDIRRVNDE